MIQRFTLVLILFAIEIFSRAKSEDIVQVNSSEVFRWCPDAPCKENPLCAQKWLFVLSTGRSGSTTLLESINLVPNIRLSGEHGGIMNNLFKFVADAEVHDNDRRQRIYQVLQDFVRHLNPPFNERSDAPLYSNILGFKELRYRTKESVNMVKQVFPCSRFIFNYREDTVAQKHSAFFKNQVKTTVQGLDDANDLIWSVYETHKSSSYLMPLGDFSPENFTLMLKWLVGPSFDCSYNKICHSNADGAYKSCKQNAKGAQKEYLQGDCKFDPHALM
jgi:hypothetical protein